MELACERLVIDLLAAGNDVQWLAQAAGELPALPAGVCKPFPGTDVFYDVAGVPVPLPFPTAVRILHASIKRSDLVVIVEANFAVSVLAYGLARLMRKEILLVQHVGQPSTVSRVARWVMKIGETLFTRPMVRNSDAVVYVSNSVAKYFKNVRGAGITETIGHAIDTEVFQPRPSPSARQQLRQQLGLPSNGPVACFVGRTTASKGMDIIRRMAEMRSDWSFAIAGHGPIEPRNWMLPNVIALGQLTKEEVAGLYSASDVMILPSQSESFSLVVREALACQCPVICSTNIIDTDNRISEFIHVADVDLDQPEITSRKFCLLLEEATMRGSQNGRDYVLRECAPERVNEKYLKVVRRILLQDHAGAR